MPADADRLQPDSPAVLVVEDEMLVQMLVVDVVTDLGLTPLEASDGPSALAILDSAGPISLMVTDVGLPGMNGRQLFEQARRRRPDLRVLFVTGDGQAATLSGLGEGVDVISKPFALEDLSRKITEMVGRG